jgi:hypothetical protein
MWLEETAWIWLPIASAFGAWMVWRMTVLKREVRTLSRRVAELEEARTTPARSERAASALRGS